MPSSCSASCSTRPAYVATWLADAGERGNPSYVDRYDAWLDGLEREQVSAVGFGFVVLRRTDAERRVTTLDWPHPVEQPLGPHLATWLDRQRWLADHDSDASLAAATVRLAPDVVQEQLGLPGRRGPAARRPAPADRTAARLRGRHGHRGAGRCVRRDARRGQTGRRRPRGARRRRVRGDPAPARPGACHGRGGCPDTIPLTGRGTMSPRPARATSRSDDRTTRPVTTTGQAGTSSRWPRTTRSRPAPGGW